MNFSKNLEYHFNVAVASEYGVEEAVIIYNFKMQILYFKNNNKNFIEGRTWTKNSSEALRKFFPFWSSKKISRLIKNLVDKNVLIKGNFNNDRFDRTLWYAFKDEGYFLYGSESNKEVIKSDKKTRINYNIRNNYDVRTKSTNKYLKKEYKDLLEEIYKVYRFKTKIPKSIYNPTKKMIYIQNFFDAALNHKLTNKFVFNQKWLKKIDIDKILGTKNIEDLKAWLKLAVDRYRKMMKEGYWPENKKVLTDDFYTFLYNPRTQKSWFLFCVTNEPQTIEKNVVNGFKNKFNEKEKNIIETILKDNFDECLFWKKLYSVKKWYEENKPSFTLYNINWAPHCGTFYQFIEKYISFIKTWDWNSLKLGHIGIESGTWKHFIDYMRKEYDIDLQTKNRIL